MMAEFLDRAQPWATTLLLHNWPVLLYGALAIGAALSACRGPSRAAVVWLCGWLTLIVAFEYCKHGIGILRGTATYLFSMEVNPGPRAISQLLVADVFPVLAYAVGLALLFAAGVPALFALVRTRS